jgi:hypothetical protein
MQQYVGKPSFPPLRAIQTRHFGDGGQFSVHMSSPMWKITVGLNHLLFYGLPT